MDNSNGTRLDRLLRNPLEAAVDLLIPSDTPPRDGDLLDLLQREGVVLSCTAGDFSLTRPQNLF